MRRRLVILLVLSGYAGCDRAPRGDEASEAAPRDEGPAPRGVERARAPEPSPGGASDEEADERPPAEPSALPPTRGPFGDRDEETLAALRGEAIARVERGRGGRSLSFKITLESGAAGYFKPEQSFSAAHFDSEIAAYCVDRALGLGRVAPVTGRTVPWSALRAAAGGDRRVAELSIDGEGNLRGAFVAWIDGALPRFDPGRGFERALRIEPPPRVNPYQAPIDVRRSANLEERDDAEIHDRSRPRADLSPERVAELSDLVVFDYLVQNVDRWGGAFTNLRLLGAGGPLVFLDNGAGFWKGEQRLSLMERRLRSLQRFRRRTVEALRSFDEARFSACLDADPLAPVLEARRRAGLRERVAAITRSIERLEERLGDAIYIDVGGML